MLLKFENIAKVGDRIRAHDFYGRPDCYIEGVVERVGDDKGFLAFVLTVEVDGWPAPSHVTRVGTTAFVPMEVGFMEWDGRIVNLSKEAVCPSTKA